MKLLIKAFAIAASALALTLGLTIFAPILIIGLCDGTLKGWRER